MSTMQMRMNWVWVKQAIFWMLGRLWWSLTSFGTEPITLVAVVVLGGSTPTVAIITALSGATVILVPLEREGELAGGSIGISTQCKQHCSTNYMTQWECKKLLCWLSCTVLGSYSLLPYNTFFPLYMTIEGTICMLLFSFELSTWVEFEMLWHINLFLDVMISFLQIIHHQLCGLIAVCVDTMFGFCLCVWWMHQQYTRFAKTSVPRTATKTNKASIFLSSQLFYTINCEYRVSF